MMLLMLIAVILLLDLGVKDIIEKTEDSAFPKELEGTGGLAVIHKFHNPGLPMGALSRYPRLVIRIPAIVTSAAAGVFIWLLPRKGGGLHKLGLAMIIGGSLSNLYDRIVRGYVVDYLCIRWKCLKKIIFNLADVCILTGAVLFAAGELFSGSRKK